jgi:hypothetical protein
MRGFFLIALLFAFMQPAHAKSYKAGSVGYLYDSCANMLSAGAKLEDVYQTYCASFLEGYFAGASISNWIQLPPPRPNDPCGETKAQEYARINARVCTNFPNYMDKNATPAFMISTASEIVQRWIAFNLKTDSEFLEKPAALALGDLIQPGAFCDDLAKDTVVNLEPIPINPVLKKIEWKNYLKIQNDVTLDRKYAQCKGDLERYHNDPKFSFDVSWCGGEIDGFMAGIRSTSKLQENRAEIGDKRCARELDRLYKSLNVVQTMCVAPETKPMDIAEIFMKRYEAGIKKDQGFANLKALGAIGYETIYRGFLCVKAAPQSTLPKSDPLSPMP